MSQSTPLPWTAYFDRCFSLVVSTPSSRIFRIYLIAPTSPTSPIFFCHHGAGSCALSFAVFAKHLKTLLPEAGIVTYDARAHGDTLSNIAPVSKNGAVDFSLSSLARDMEGVAAAVWEKMGWSKENGVVLIGHSLGGAVVTEVAREAKVPGRMLGYAVLDVVEGSAMDALKSMKSYLATRPERFEGEEDAIDWHMRSRTLRNRESARVSVPPLIWQDASPASQPTSEGTPVQPWTWKTDLAMTEGYWEDWFGGMSAKFLSGRGGKLLILAGTDRLDKELMIGQMQGKYQLQVFPEAGHFVQEDAPEKTANILVDFWRRNDGSRLVLPPKVSDMLAQGKKV